MSTISISAQASSGGLLSGIPGFEPAPNSGPRGERTGLDAVAAEVRKQVAGQLPEDVDAQEKEAAARELIRRQLNEVARQAMAEGRTVLSDDAEAEVQKLVLAQLFGLGALQPLLDDPEIENVFVNGPSRVFVRYAGGRRAAVAPVAASDEELAEQVRLVAARLGSTERRFDRSSPSLNLQLPDGSRLFAVLADIAGFTSVSIRRHRFPTVTLDRLVELGTLDERLARILAAAVRAKLNMIIAGATDSGKTTLVRALATEFDPSERVVVIEDTSELVLDEDALAHPNVVAMQTRDANLEGVGQVTSADLVRWALRMSPDRIIVGECRSGDETTTMLEAMSVGNDGSLTTLHASSSAVVFDRLQLLLAKGQDRMNPQTAAMQIAQSAHLILHLGVLSDGTRAVSSLREITGAEGERVISNEIYRPDADGRGRAATPFSAPTLAKLRRAGLADADAVIAPLFEGWSS